MKAALLLENDQVERDRLVKILRWLGYVAAPVRTPEQALNVADALNFDIIVTSTAVKPNDRRSLTSELKRVAPESAIVYVTGQDDEYREARAGRYPCVSAVLKKPTTMDALRRLVQFGVDGFGVPLACLPACQERRRKAS